MEASLSPSDSLSRAPRSPRRLIITIPVAALLLTTIFLGTSAYLHSQLLALGQTMWDNYGVIRHDIPEPTCDLNPDIDALVERQVQRAQQSQADSLLPPAPPNREAIRRSLLAQQAQCEQRYAAYEYSQQMRESGMIRLYSSIEAGVGRMAVTGLHAQQYLLVSIILMCAWIASVVRGHIALRTPETALDSRVGAAAQLVANGMLLFSAWRWREVAEAAGANSSPWVHILWITGFGVLTLISLYQVIRVPVSAKPGGSLGHALLTIPLYTVMALIAGSYFLISESYASGLAVQLLKMISHADLYINVGLYVWVGMLLKQTRLAELVFDVIRPWKLAPELIVIVVVLAAAFPTAFTGASGIFLIAVGAVIYHEIRMSGARRQLAFAATAMSGSMGVVLNPCLMVVVIAALNKQVTTGQLFGWGSKVFLLTAVLFALVVLITKRNKLTFAPPREALPASLKAMVPLLPYVLIAAAAVLFFSQVLDQRFSEFSAPVILPVVMLLMLLYDRVSARRQAKTAAPETEEAQEGFWFRVREATSESTVHIGALLMLMALSVVLGGVVERAGIMDAFPSDFASIWTAMAAMVVILVIIGMFMDPYGAIILVSATIATIGYEAGIHPVHFWMVVLVAFELGYLTPPVALNQLLTRQVVGDQELYRALEDQRSGKNFWQRHEQMVLPLAVMASALVLVAFVPLLVGY